MIDKVLYCACGQVLVNAPASIPAGPDSHGGVPVADRESLAKTTCWPSTEAVMVVVALPDMDKDSRRPGGVAADVMRAENGYGGVARIGVGPLRVPGHKLHAAVAGLVQVRSEGRP